MKKAPWNKARVMQDFRGQSWWLYAVPVVKPKFAELREVEDAIDAHWKWLVSAGFARPRAGDESVPDPQGLTHRLDEHEARAKEVVTALGFLKPVDSARFRQLSREKQSATAAVIRSLRNLTLFRERLVRSTDYISQRAAAAARRSPDIPLEEHEASERAIDLVQDGGRKLEALIKKLSSLERVLRETGDELEAYQGTLSKRSTKLKELNLDHVYQHMPDRWLASWLRDLLLFCHRDVLAVKASFGGDGREYLVHPGPVTVTAWHAWRREQIHMLYGAGLKAHETDQLFPFRDDGSDLDTHQRAKRRSRRKSPPKRRSGKQGDAEE